jgi:hypothetical protein
MRSEWEALHQGLVRTISTKEAERLFDGLRRRGTAVSRFDAALELVEYLAHPGGDLDEKDLILTELATATIAGPAASLAMTLLLLGLWPGLDAVFGRRTRFCHDQAGELAAEMIACFTDQVRLLKPDRVHRVAATLVRSTERNVRRLSVREHRRRRRGSRVPIEVAENVNAAVWAVEEIPSAAEVASVLCPKAASESRDEAIAVLRSWLAELIGRDADLVIDAVLLNRPRLELGLERGIGKWAARKRLQRALVRIRKRLEGQIPASRGGEGWRLPGHEHETRVPGLSGLG